MNTSISIVVKSAAKNTPKNTTFDYKVLKTQTNLELSFEKKDQAAIDFPVAIAEDLAALGFVAEPIGPVSFIITGAQSLGKIHNRSVTAYTRAGITIEEIGWDDDGGMIEFVVEGGTVLDLPGLLDVVTRTIFRATTKFTNTRHPLSLYDLKQSVGLVSDAKNELGEAQTTLDWFSVREMAILEEAKAIKAEARDKTAAAKKAEVTAAKAIAGGVDTKDTKATAKAIKAAAKKAKTAPLTVDGEDPNE